MPPPAVQPPEEREMTAWTTAVPRLFTSSRELVARSAAMHLIERP